jgi:hypothetical protein
MLYIKLGRIFRSSTMVASFRSILRVAPQSTRRGESAVAASIHEFMSFSLFLFLFLFLSLSLSLPEKPTPISSRGQQKRGSLEIEGIMSAGRFFIRLARGKVQSPSVRGPRLIPGAQILRHGLIRPNIPTWSPLTKRSFDDISSDQCSITP